MGNLRQRRTGEGILVIPGLWWGRHILLCRVGCLWIHSLTVGVIGDIEVHASRRLKKRNILGGLGGSPCYPEACEHLLYQWTYKGFAWLPNCRLCFAERNNSEVSTGNLRGENIHEQVHAWPSLCTDVLFVNFPICQTLFVTLKSIA